MKFMSFAIEIQRVDKTALPFNDQQIISWAKSALTPLIAAAELTIRIVGETEIRSLNKQYRHKDDSTNVLSFPSSVPQQIQEELKTHFIGDIIICPSVLTKESDEQAKALEHHWAHMVVHGILHLLGYDHIQAADETKMQTLEIQILQQLGIDNPYE